MVTGVVKMTDGSDAPGNVTVRLTCGGLPVAMTHTMVNSDFTFRFAGSSGHVQAKNNTVFSDALAGANAETSFPGYEISDRPENCEIRAESAGYSSNAVSLTDGNLAGADEAVVWLRSTARTNGSSLVSVTSLGAPNSAKKNFDKGTELVFRNKLSEATASFEKAVSIYPAFAEAWASLGAVQYEMKENDAANRSLTEAIRIDGKLTRAWLYRGYISAGDQRWEDAAHDLAEATRLEPLISSRAWYCAALAAYELKRYDEAKRNIRKSHCCPKRSESS